MKNIVFGIIIGILLSIILVLGYLFIRLGKVVSQDTQTLAQVVQFLQKNNPAPATASATK